MVLTHVEFEWIDEITYTVVGEQGEFYKCIGHCYPPCNLLLTYDEILVNGNINHF